MAPEQWTGTMTAQSDIYSLGIVFYEMVTGRKPYTADTPAAVLLKQATEPLPRPLTYVSDLPEAVEKVILKALALKPEYRYADMAGFAVSMEALQKITDSSAQSSVPLKPLQSGEKPLARERRLSQKIEGGIVKPPEDIQVHESVENATEGGATIDQIHTATRKEGRGASTGVPSAGIFRGRSPLWAAGLVIVTAVCLLFCGASLGLLYPKILLSPSATNTTSNLQAITTGVNHTCMLTVGGGVKCWGWNNWGQLGDGTNDNSSIPVDVRLLSSGVQAIAAGQYHTCAVTFGGGVKCWGWNNWGQLGDGTNDSNSIPMDVSELDSGIQAIGVGVDYTCALTSDGGVKCWGSNRYEQLGDGTDHDSSKPVDVNGLGSGVQAISVGYWHTCALTSEGGVKCWGSNGDGELGDGTKHSSSMPVDVIGLSSGVQAIAAGGSHTCALTADGGVKCWGSNWGGQLGNGSNINDFMPVDVSGLSSGVQAIATGRSHSCALTAEGGVKCWGWNGDGQLGDGTNHISSTPVDVSGLSSGVWTIAAGGRHTCALAEGSVAMCWGWNGHGQLGDGTDATSSIPVSVQMKLGLLRMEVD
jgi:alpha-tubulin suppressor-like RCC1 family protein